MLMLYLAFVFNLIMFALCLWRPGSTPATKGIYNYETHSLNSRHSCACLEHTKLSSVQLLF